MISPGFAQTANLTLRIDLSNSNTELLPHLCFHSLEQTLTSTDSSISRIKSSAWTWTRRSFEKLSLVLSLSHCLWPCWERWSFWEDVSNISSYTHAHVVAFGEGLVVHSVIPSLRAHSQSMTTTFFLPKNESFLSARLLTLSHTRIVLWSTMTLVSFVPFLGLAFLREGELRLCRLPWFWNKNELRWNTSVLWWTLEGLRTNKQKMF
jgi:hypothetical protein